MLSLQNLFSIHFLLLIKLDLVENKCDNDNFSFHWVSGMLKF